jgi:D-alanyl-D-alanine carboxypeptidase/D-alanyl-D-alanine-endopeptidase (penicillin-binding protein 4)
MKISLQRHVAAWLLLLSIFQYQAIGQQPAPIQTRQQTPEELRSRISALLDQPQFAAARIGARIITYDGSVIFDRDANKVFMPASNMKLYTTAAALDLLGPDYKIRTSVFASKRISRDGILRGDLILVGRGDPNLSSRFDGGRIDEFRSASMIPAIEAMADQIKAHGIKRIIGDVVGDDSYFASDALGSGWEWDDAQFYYGAEVSALTVNDNAVTVTVTPSPRAGRSPIIRLDPETAFVKVVNHASTVSGREAHIGIDRPLESNTIEVFGSIGATAPPFHTDVAVHEPARFAATLFKEALARRGIRVTGGVRRVGALQRIAQPFDAGSYTELAFHISEPMAVLIKVVNKQSQNLHAEMLLRQLGVVKGEPQPYDLYGRPRSAESRGISVLKLFLERANVDTKPLSVQDGSGLSRHDLVTPEATSQLLKFMAAHKDSLVFKDSLCVAGVDGTLERRMRGTPAAGNLRGKTGTLAYVNSLSGYLTTRSGQALILSLMANNYTGAGRDVTAVFDQICVLLAEW